MRSTGSAAFLQKAAACRTCLGKFPNQLCPPHSFVTSGAVIPTYWASTSASFTSGVTTSVVMGVSVVLLVIYPSDARLGALSAQQVHVLPSGFPASAKTGGALCTGHLCCMVLIRNLACTASDCIVRRESLLHPWEAVAEHESPPLQR